MSPEPAPLSEPGSTRASPIADLRHKGESWKAVLLQLMIHVWVFGRFLLAGGGREYGVGILGRLRLALRVVRINLAISTLTSPAKQLWIIDELLRVPRSVPGDVVECGCFNGSSSASLSVACALTGRRLFVCDSFEGLPEPEGDEKFDITTESDSFYVWEKGEFKSEGALEGVRDNIAKYGEVEVCEFVKGYFDETLADIPTDEIAMVFEDADLASSARDCLLHLWPRLQPGCCFFSDEPWSVHVVGLFYDAPWWREHMDSQPPGFIGSGRGILGMPVGYARKIDFEAARRDGTRRVVRGSQGFEER